MFDALNSTSAGSLLAERARSALCPSSQHGWNAPLPVGGLEKGGMSLRALPNGPLALPLCASNRFQSCCDAVEFFNTTPCLPWPHILRGAGGEPGQAQEVHSHAGSPRRTEEPESHGSWCGNGFCSRKRQWLKLPWPGFGGCLTHPLVPLANSLCPGVAPAQLGSNTTAYSRGMRNRWLPRASLKQVLAQSFRGRDN